jgi:hypothetical protein
MEDGGRNVADLVHQCFVRVVCRPRQDLFWTVGHEGLGGHDLARLAHGSESDAPVRFSRKIVQSDFRLGGRLAIRHVHRAAAFRAQVADRNRDSREWV